MISVGLAFKRFLEIATLLGLDVCVVTDNDGNVAALRAKYTEYMTRNDATLRILYDEDEACGTLEPQLLKANSLEALNTILGTHFVTDSDLLAHMTKNKTDCALRMFEAEEEWSTPGYIADAIN